MNFEPETRNLNLVTLIPAKPFAEAKTRLADVLSGDERARLSRRLLRRTIRMAKTVGEVAVVSRSAAVRRVAKDEGAWALVESGAELNAAIRQGLAWATQHGADTALILPADLPLLSPADLQALLAQMETAHTAVIAPCRRETGTNALLLPLPAPIAPEFGENSFPRHCAAAKRTGIPLAIFRTRGIAFDLDTVTDWQDYRRTTKFVRQPDEFSGV